MCQDGTGKVQRRLQCLPLVIYAGQKKYFPMCIVSRQTGSCKPATVEDTLGARGASHVIRDSGAWFVDIERT